jgi:nucleoid-associated protein YgaU
MPLEADLYIVKKGDTLWAISKRFTGNPFNYPRVARDNKIANPDLIFPDQKIHLKR